MYVKVKTQVNLSAVKNLVQKQRDALYLTAEELKDDVITSQTMPYDNGTMQNEDTFVVMGFSKDIRVMLITGGPYGRYQYYGISRSGNPLNYQTVNNPYARSEWLEPYLDGEFINNAYSRHLAEKLKEGG